jgi:hypothetical protein
VCLICYEYLRGLGIGIGLRGKASNALRKYQIKHFPAPTPTPAAALLPIQLTVVVKLHKNTETSSKRFVVVAIILREVSCNLFHCLSFSTCPFHYRLQIHVLLSKSFFINFIERSYNCFCLCMMQKQRTKNVYVRVCVWMYGCVFVFLYFCLCVLLIKKVYCTCH